VLEATAELRRDCMLGACGPPHLSTIVEPNHDTIAPASTEYGGDALRGMSVPLRISVYARGWSGVE
jgi:hypothetical protein